MISGEVPDVLGHRPGKRPVQHNRRPCSCRITAVRNIGRQSHVTHQRRDQHVRGWAVAHRENVDRVRSKQHGRFAGAGVGIGKVSRNNLYDIKLETKCV